MGLELATEVLIKETVRLLIALAICNADGYGNDVFSSEFEFLENLFIIECQ